MTLLDYLKTNPVADVRAALTMNHTDSMQPFVVGGGKFELRHALCAKWMLVSLTGSGFAQLNAYYRRGFIISDCGESISDLIRRTGLESEAAQDRVHQICEDGISLDDVNAPGLDVFAIRCQCKADRLAEAIIAVLSVVARVGEAS